MLTLLYYWSTTSTSNPALLVELCTFLGLVCLCTSYMRTQDTLSCSESAHKCVSMIHREWRGADGTAGLGHWTHETDGSLPLAQLERPIPWASPRRATSIHTYMCTLNSATRQTSLVSYFRVGNSTQKTLEQSPVQVFAELNTDWFYWSYDNCYFQVDKLQLTIIRGISEKEVRVTSA